MKNRLIILLIISMLATMSACGSTAANNDYEVGNTQTELEETETQQPEATGVESLQYWLEKIEKPDDVLLSIKDIEKQNALTRKNLK